MLYGQPRPDYGPAMGQPYHDPQCEPRIVSGILAEQETPTKYFFEAQRDLKHHGNNPFHAVCSRDMTISMHGLHVNVKLTAGA